MKKFTKILGLGLIALTAFASLKVEAREIELLGTSLSPYVRKVKNVLDYKNLNYKQSEILPRVVLEATGQQIPENFKKASPLGKIPALTVDNVTIADSAVIVAYLEKQVPSRRVYPRQAANYARTLWIEKYADTVMTDVVHPIFIERVVKPMVFSSEPDEQQVSRLAHEELPKILDYLNQQLMENGTEYLATNQMTVADFAVIHHLIDLDIAEIAWKTGEFSYLERYYQKMINNRLIRNSLPKDFLEKIN
ncbi:MAG: glutathione S-transferase family protein [Chlamydiales bacterium]